MCRYPPAKKINTKKITNVLKEVEDYAVVHAEIFRKIMETLETLTE